MSEIEEDKNKKDKENRLLLIIGIILCLCSPFILLLILLKEYFFESSTVFLSSIGVFLLLMPVILFFLGFVLIAINCLRKKPQKGLEGETKSYAKERIKQIGQIQRLLSRIILVYAILLSVLFILGGWMSRTINALVALVFLLTLVHPFLLFVLLGGAILLILQFVKWIIKKHNKISEE